MTFVLYIATVLNTQPSFDSAAEKYDDTFTHSSIGKRQRERVYYWLRKARFFDSPKKIFEINCGTGYDADQFTSLGHSVIATDGSHKMIAISKQLRKNAIDFFQLDFKCVHSDTKFQNADCLFSNFGGLNCLSPQNLESFSAQVSTSQKPKDLLIWVIMPKVCIMESLFLLLKGKFSQAFRRNSKHGLPINVDGEQIMTYYYSPKEIKALLKDNYSFKFMKPVAICLPPSYLESFFSKNKRLLNFLSKLENTLGRFTWLAKWSDHFIVIAEKK